MGSGLTRDWAEQVVALCDPVFLEADVEFEHTISFGPDGAVQSLLWEADPAKFATKYPDSGVVEMYGEQWVEAHCIDLWVTFEEPGYARIAVEGWNLPDLYLKLSGRSSGDGYDLRNTFGRILGVVPRVD